MEQKNLRLLQARSIVPNRISNKYSRILGGFPDSVCMKSGLITLKPGEEVGVHSTGINEELLIVLSGSGKFTLKSGDDICIGGGGFLYCPPETAHNVVNTSVEDLVYVYVVSKALYS